MEKVAAGTTGSSQKKCTMDFSKTLIKSGWREGEKAPVGSTAIFFTLLPPGISQPFESSFEQAHKVQWETFGGATW